MNSQGKTKIGLKNESLKMDVKIIIKSCFKIYVQVAWIALCAIRMIELKKRLKMWG